MIRNWNEEEYDMEVEADIEEETEQTLYDEIEQLIEDTRIGLAMEDDRFEKMVVRVIQGLAKVYK